MASVRQHTGSGDAWQHSSKRSDNQAAVDLSAGTINSSNDKSKRFSGLIGAIEGEIIPRLLLVHRTDGCDGDNGNEVPFSDADVERFVRLAIANDFTGTVNFIDRAQAAGASLENVFLHLLAPAARLLGKWWEDDICGFAEVTLGLMQLRQVLHVFSRELDGEISAVHDVGPSALLVPVPGAQHSFGVSVVVEFFRRAGWDVCDEPVGCADDLLALVRADSFDLVGLSVGSDEFLLGLGKLIAEIRKAARNRDVRIMVGGKCFLEKPWLAAELGADATATDARQAVSRARNLVKSRGLTSK